MGEVTTQFAPLLGVNTVLFSFETSRDAKYMSVIRVPLLFFSKSSTDFSGLYNIFK
jgi:hypothetical protein